MPSPITEVQGLVIGLKLNIVTLKIQTADTLSNAMFLN